MNNFFRNKPLVITSITIIILLVLLIGTSGRTDVSGAQTVAGGIFVPVQKFFYQLTDNVSSFFESNTTGATLSEENASLKEQVTELKTELADYDELQKENERLTKLLDYKDQNPSYELKVAQIVSKDPGNWFDVFSISLGSGDGIEVGMPVITADGVVGSVKEVGLNWSKVVSVIDGSSGISSIVERTRDIGSVRGRVGNDPTDTLLDMDYLPISTDIVVGDRVLTSGVDEVYPKGLLIGDVVEVGEQGNEKKVVINPAVNYKSLEEVMVLAAVNDSAATAQSEDISAQVQPSASASADTAANTAADTGSGN